MTTSPSDSLLALLLDLVRGLRMEFFKRLVSDLVHAELTIPSIVARSLRFLIVFRMTTKSTWGWSSTSSHSKTASRNVGYTSSEALRWSFSDVLRSDTSSISSTLPHLPLVVLPGCFKMEPLVLSLSSLVRQVARR